MERDPGAAGHGCDVAGVDAAAGRGGAAEGLGRVRVRQAEGALPRCQLPAAGPGLPPRLVGPLGRGPLSGRRLSWARSTSSGLLRGTEDARGPEAAQ